MKSVFVRKVGELKERELDAVLSDSKMKKRFAAVPDCVQTGLFNEHHS